MHIGKACIMKVKRRFRPLGSVLTASPTTWIWALFNPNWTHIMSRRRSKHRFCSTWASPQLLWATSKLWASKLLESLFATACRGKGITSVPHGYIQNSLSAMHHLQAKGKSNILAGTAFVFGNMKPGQSESRFPTDRMPFGLFEHCINFYRADSINEVYRAYHFIK